MALAARSLGAGATWSWLTPLLRYPPGRFLHGAALVGGRLTVVFYFEAHEIWLACITGRECLFARLCKLELPPGTMLARDRGRG